MEKSAPKNMKKLSLFGRSLGDDHCPLWLKQMSADGKAMDYIIHKNPYPTLTLYILDFIVLKLFRPCKFFLDAFLACFFPTTKELQKPWVLLPNYFLVIPLTFLATLITLPLSGLAFIMWYMLNKQRKTPYRVSYVASAIGKSPELKTSYRIGTSNFCLLPEFIARINNLDHLYHRAEAIGRSIASGQLQHKLDKQNKYFSNNNYARQRTGRHSTKSKVTHEDDQNQVNQTSYQDTMDHSILTDFPELDILCIQEGFDKEAATVLAKQLHNAFPYFIYDVGVDSWETNYWLSNSGLCIASKYPIDDIWVGVYKHSCSQCALASKGLLCVKVYLGNRPDGKRVVGYVANTHMQAYQGTSNIHYMQFDECYKWLDEFRQNTLKPSEVVAFDIFGGDFNVDNLSPVDEVDYNHPIFDKYHDVGRIKAGQDYDWAIGTEMRHIPLHDAKISTPAGLKAALEDPFMLQHYILDGDISSATIEIASFMPHRDDQGRAILSPVGGKRRIDYITFRKDDGVVPLAYNPVTQLAGLTDHIPMTLTIQPGI